LKGRFAFLVVASHPQTEAFKSISQLRRDEEFRLVLLSHHRLFDAQEGPAWQVLKDSVRWWLGKEDLFHLREPVRDVYDFFGRGQTLQTLVEACQKGRVMGLGGMARVGKTSLAWQVANRLPGAIVARIEAGELSQTGLYMTLRQTWLSQAGIRFHTWEPPSSEPLPEQPTGDQIQTDLEKIRASLLKQSPTAHVIAILDGLNGRNDSEEVETLRRAIAAMDRVSLISVFDTWPRPEPPFQVVPLCPFDAETSYNLIESLGLQMEREFDPPAQESLYQASGGHPLLLRQMASLTVIQAGGERREIDAALVNEMLAQSTSELDAPLSKLFSQFWDPLTLEERLAIRSAIGGDQVPTDGLLKELIAMGWLIQRDGRWQLFSQTLDRWLHTHRPVQA
jgi:hypothetical protein